MNKIVKSLLVIISFFFYYIIIFIPFVLLEINIENVPTVLLQVYQIATEIIYISIIIFAYKDDFKRYLDDFKKNGKKHFKLGFDYWLIGLAVMIVSNIAIGNLTPIAIPENEQMIREAIAMNPFIMLISSVVLAPVLEEILFRKTLFDIFKNKYVYIITSGLLFGFFHVVGVATSIYSWLYVIPYAALGVVFAYAYKKTNNLLTPISMHALHNFITIIQLLMILWGIYEEKKTFKKAI